jgi:hypothetical protein
MTVRPDRQNTTPRDARAVPAEGITRRSALGLLGAAGVVAAGVTITSGCDTTPNWPGILAIGTAYCVANPAEADPDVLESLLPAGVVRTATPPTNLYKAGATIKRDFHDGRTVMLSGWILSVTEARVCALWYVRLD